MPDESQKLRVYTWEEIKDPHSYSSLSTMGLMFRSGLVRREHAPTSCSGDRSQALGSFGGR